MSQTRLTPGPLLDEQGHLSQAGYATNLVKTYDRKKIKAAKLRIKEWDYYLIHNQEFALAMTVADNAYMGLISASFLNFTTGEQHTVSPMLILPMGKLNMPADSEAGDIHVKNKRAQVHFTHQSDGRRLQFEMADFQDGFPLVADLHLSPTMKESMVIATPFPNKPKAFYYNQKIVGMRASGSVHYKNKEYRFDPTDSLGLLDWGRGVWTYDNTWYWSAANGIIDGKVFGFNLGYGFGDPTAATENMLFYDGAHKLEEVSFHIPKKPDGGEDYLSPWRFSSSDGRFEASFKPILDRSALTSFKILLSDQHQVFGYFTGKAVLDSGETLVFDHLLGFAEKVRNKW